MLNSKGNEMPFPEPLDTLLIGLYRISGHPIWDYFLGTLLLAWMSVLIGELTISIVFRVNRAHIARLDRRMARMKTLSEQALEAGDAESYRACNREANDAFGHLFFNKFGLSAASLWPPFLALGWMQSRFLDVQFPLAFPLSRLFGETVGYAFTFIPLYILCRILFRYARPYLPYFRSVQELLK